MKKEHYKAEAHAQRWGIWSSSRLDEATFLSGCVDPAAAAAEIMCVIMIFMEEHGPWSRLVFAKLSFAEQGCQVWL